MSSNQATRADRRSTAGSGAAAADSKTKPVRSHSARGRSALATGAAIVLALALSVPVAALTAHTISVNDTGHLHLLKAVGSVLSEEGYASGTLPGQAKVRMDVGSTSVSATFTIQTRQGTIYGSGHAALHSSGRYTSFGGSLTVSHGSGRYRHAHGSGKLYGVIDRRGDALTVQTLGKLTY